MIGDNMWWKRKAINIDKKKKKMLLEDITALKNHTIYLAREIEKLKKIVEELE